MRAEMRFNAIVLAADRGRDDPVAAAAGVAAKCLTPVAGVPMVVRVIRALRESACVDTILLCGPAAEIAAGIAGTAPDGRREARSLDGPAWHAVRQRRGRAGAPCRKTSPCS